MLPHSAAGATEAALPVAICMLEGAGGIVERKLGSSERKLGSSFVFKLLGDAPLSFFGFAIARWRRNETKGCGAGTCHETNSKRSKRRGLGRQFEAFAVVARCILSFRACLGSHLPHYTALLCATLAPSMYAIACFSLPRSCHVLLM